MPLHPVVEKVQHIEAEIGSYLLGRTAEIHGAMLGLAARQHLFLLGPPGTAKSLLAAEVARRIRDAHYFPIGLHAFVLRDEIFGPVSLGALRERDALERKYQGYLPDAHVALLDEIWKCPGATLNTMLNLLNERTFRNDDAVLAAPLVSAITTSNEMPPADRSLDALYDRILLRYEVRALTDPAQRQAASRFGIGMRAFENAVVRIAAELRERRIDGYLETAAVLGEADEEGLAALSEAYATDALPDGRIERWLIDRYGELIADASARAALAAGRVDGARLPRGEDGRALLGRAAAWLDERKIDLPYRTFLRLPDLDDLHGLVLECAMTPAVEAAFYRVLDEVGSASVRRETELRLLVAAEAVLAGRAKVGMGDLRVMIHALWDRPELAPEIARIVDKEVGDADAELAALLGSLHEWKQSADEPRSVTERIALREQMDQELGRISGIADAFPERSDLAGAIREASAFRDDFDAAIFHAEGAAPDADDELD